MANGSGDDFSVVFTSAGVLIRGFDHESRMSPYRTDDEQVWPGVTDEVPLALRPLLDEPAFHDEEIDAPRVTTCPRQATGDTAWRTGSAIAFPPGSEDYYERTAPSTPSAMSAQDIPSPPRSSQPLSPTALSDNAILHRIAGHSEAASHLPRNGESDLARTDPIVRTSLPNGLPVEPVAGCNAGGTHCLCGPAAPGSPHPVLYTDSEGRASLIARSLTEALTLTIVPPSWHDALAGVRFPCRPGSFVWIRRDQGAGPGAVHRKAAEGVRWGLPCSSEAESSRKESWRPTTTPRGAVPDPASPA